MAHVARHLESRDVLRSDDTEADPRWLLAISPTRATDQRISNDVAGGFLESPVPKRPRRLVLPTGGAPRKLTAPRRIDSRHRPGPVDRRELPRATAENNPRPAAPLRTDPAADCGPRRGSRAPRRRPRSVASRPLSMSRLSTTTAGVHRDAELVLAPASRRPGGEVVSPFRREAGRASRTGRSRNDGVHTRRGLITDSGANRGGIALKSITY
jgi:hypothetical protein